ncbi:MAG: NUDIX hydrolase [Bacteroidia bacterium]|nr:NUDIX hydrolase [Bacteroidia bacterium]
MNFCSHCGAAVTLKDVPGDHRKRYVCDSCEHIHYQNPIVIAGVLPLWEGKILMAKRAIEPRLGFWNLPAGFLENGENVEDGAKRELWEETEAKVSDMTIHSVYTVARINQVHIHFLADLIEEKFNRTPESSEVRLFEVNEIPWGDVAFASTFFSLQRYVEDLKKGVKEVHLGHFEFKSERKLY